MLKLSVTTIVAVCGIIVGGIFAYQQNNISATQAEISARQMEIAANQNNLDRVQNILDLVDILGSYDVVRREHAVLGLVDIGPDAVKYLFLAMLAPEQSKSNAANNALVQIGINPLALAISLVDGDKPYDLSAIVGVEVLCRLGSTDGIDPLAALLEQDDLEDNLRLKAIESLGCIDGPESIEVLESQLASGSQHVLLSAVRSLRRHVPSSSDSIVITLGRWADNQSYWSPQLENVRLEVISIMSEAWAVIDKTESKNVVLDILRTSLQENSESNWRNRSKAVEILEHFPPHANVTSLLKIALEDPHDKVKAMALGIQARRAQQGCLDIDIAMLDDPRNYVVGSDLEEIVETIKATCVEKNDEDEDRP